MFLVHKINQIIHKKYVTHHNPKMSKRQSLMPAAPPTPVHIVSHPRCKNPVMADGLSITGTFPVFVGGDSVIHPKCKLDAKTGPVKVGMRCIVEERAVIGGAATSLNAPGVVPEGTVKMGDYVTIETGAMVDAGVTINTGCQIGQKCQIGAGAVLGKVRHSITASLEES